MPADKPTRCRPTQFGFLYGAASVHRMMSHKGHVLLAITTPRQTVEIRVTPSGMIRVAAPRKPYPHELEEMDNGE